MSQPIKIMGISGSYENDSANSRLIELLFHRCNDLGAITYTWDNKNKPLPLVGENGSWDSVYVKEFQEMASSVDAFVLSSPEFHGTMSGVMKNNLDWIYSKHCSGKIFGLMSTLGGQSTSNTLNHMRIVVRWIHGWAVPEQIAVPNIKTAFDESGLIIDVKINERLDKLAESIMINSSKLRR